MTPKGQRRFEQLREAASAIKARSRGRLDDFTAWQLAERQLARTKPADMFERTQQQ